MSFESALDRVDDPKGVERSTQKRQALLVAMKPYLLSVLCSLYASEINVSICISSLWDEGWEVKLGDTVHGFKSEKTFANAEPDQVAPWLAEQASLHYPESDFARRFACFQKGSLGQGPRLKKIPSAPSRSEIASPNKELAMLGAKE